MPTDMTCMIVVYVQRAVMCVCYLMSVGERRGCWTEEDEGCCVDGATCQGGKHKRKC